MFSIPQYKERVSLIPGGCPHFLDFEVDLTSLPRLRRSFEERRQSLPDKVKTLLYPLQEVDTGMVDMLEGKPAQGNAYQRDGLRSLQPWLGQWIPVPFLREREQLWPDTEERRVECGPSNWARVRLVMSEDKPDTLRVVLAFDMQVEETGDDLPYAALCPQDVSAHAQFRLAWHPRDNSWFLNEEWVDDWLLQVWSSKQKKRRPDDDGPELDHLAQYLTMLEMLHNCIKGTVVYVINPEHHSPVNVDLVLDIGNSRTTGILVETRAQSATNLNDSYLLQLRDMDRPEFVYTDPFDTRVEFSEISLGNEALSKRSRRRTTAFAFPSPVRIGPEAARLSTQAACAEGATGMSSPKRYLWDERDWQQSWRFNTKGHGEPYVTSGPLMGRVNASGTPLYYIETGHPSVTRNPILKNQENCCAFESLFTRSSLMMFLLVEVLQQALLTINSPGQRGRRDMPDVPRRLRQVIFTVPAGMPIAEQRIYRRWAKWAVRVLWEALGWEAFYAEKPTLALNGNRVDYRANPQVRCNWDEATCTQLVYIYNEITRKHQGDARQLCRMVGRPRAQYGNKPCLRVATIDIGGGTTDLSITTFELQSDVSSAARMAPHLELRDGFNLAGDDVLCAVVAECVLPAIGEAMTANGIKDARAALAHLFGRDVMDSSQESRNRRIQFVRQVAVPVALAMLAHYEKADLRTGSGVYPCTLRQCFHFPVAESTLADRQDKAATQAIPLPATSTQSSSTQSSPMTGTEREWPLPFTPAAAPHEAALAYVQDYIRHHGNNPDFDILDIPLRMDPRSVDESVRSCLRGVLADLCEVIHLYDCDMLLLTGRPSCWQGIVNTIYAHLPVPPDRILPMGSYRVGGWYPFSDALGRMSDPKTTVVVGAILCALAEGQLEGFSFDPANLALTSTARFIGEMELNGQIKAPKVWFEVDVNDKNEREYQREISFAGPIAVGFRQLSVERWTTTRFYYLEFASEDARRNYASVLPFSIKLTLTVQELDDEAPRGLENVERDEGEFRIESITDRNGEDVNPKVLEMRLQTLPRHEGFWLDTGIILG